MPASWIWFYPALTEQGQATRNGFNCPNLSLPLFRKGRFYPDFVISQDGPRADSKPKSDSKSILIGDVKLSGNSLYNQYVNQRSRQPKQFNAITRYAGQHTYGRTAVFLTAFTGNRSKLKQVGRLLGGDGLKEGVIVFVISAQKNKHYRR